MSGKTKLERLYETATAYDLHYSTVRTATSTFLIAVGLAIGEFLLRGDDPGLEAVIVPLVVFAFTIVLNLHFQALTWGCRKIQEWVETADSEVSAAHLARHPAIGAIDARIARNERRIALRESRAPWLFDHRTEGLAAANDRLVEAKQLLLSDVEQGLLFRANLQRLYDSSDPVAAARSDRPLQLVLFGVAAYVIVVLLRLWGG